jgi:hypothetical protein
LQLKPVRPRLCGVEVVRSKRLDVALVRSLRARRISLTLALEFRWRLGMLQQGPMDSSESPKLAWVQAVTLPENFFCRPKYG